MAKQSAKRSQPAPARGYLILASEYGPAAAEGLAHLLAGTGIASVLLQPQQRDAFELRQLAMLVRAVQSRDVAAVIEADFALCAELAADGVHLPFQEDDAAAVAAYALARQRLGADAIVGVDAGLSRHRAMTLGELGADYIAFAPAPAVAATSQTEMVAWWSQMFEPPCVAWSVADRGDAQGLIAAGADFLAVGQLAGETVAQACARLAYYLAVDTDGSAR
jgi:thiamine-phosphate pyrophosphorylase